MNQPTSKPITLYLARHATPDWSRKDIPYDIPPGPPLIPAGETEAAQLGEFLRTVGVTQLYASPLERTRHTAEIAGEIAHAPVAEEPSIAEYRFGENDAGVLERMQAFVDRVMAESAENGPVALVSHGGPVRVLLEHFGLSGDEMWHYRRQFDHQNPLPPAGAWAVIIDPPLQPDRTQASIRLELVFSPGDYEPYTN